MNFCKFCFIYLPRHGAAWVLKCDGFSFLFSAKILQICTTDFNQIFEKASKPWSLEFVKPEFWIFVCWGQRVKNTEKSEISDIRVQSFSYNSETNQDIKNRNSSMTSTINSEDNDIQMSLNVFDLDLHRLSHLSNIFNFWDVNLYNSLTFELSGIHLYEVFLFATTNSIFLTNFIKIGSVFFFKNSENPCLGSRLS